MAAVHRKTDLRSCGATTLVIGQSTVYANNLLISVDGDPNSHDGGELVAACNQVFINNKLVVDIGDSAVADNLCPSSGGLHCTPKSDSGSPNVFVGG